jgi:hypothetical protein
MYYGWGTSPETTAVLSVCEAEKIGNSDLNLHESGNLLQCTCKIQSGHKVLVRFDGRIEYFISAMCVL